MTALHIDDGQPPERQPDAGNAVEAFVVRPTMVHGIGHGLQHGAVDRCFTPRLEDAADPTHDDVTYTPATTLASCHSRAGCFKTPGSITEYSRYRTSSPFSQFMFVRPHRLALCPIALRTS